MVSDGLTPKQKCIKKIAYFFRHRFLRWYSHTHLKKLRKKASRRPPRGRKLKYRKSTRHSSWRFSAPRRRSTWVYRSTRHRRRYPKRAKKKSKSENLFGIKIQKNSLSKKSKAFHLLKNHWRNFLSHRFKSKNREIYAEDQIWYMLNYYERLPLKYKMGIKSCNLNMGPALDRCQSLYGENSCQVVSPTIVQKKCPEGKQQVGCCECAQSCPKSEFETKGFYCKKVKFYTVLSFNSLKECVKYVGSGTGSNQKEKYGCKEVKKNVFQPDCKTGFSKEEINGQVTCLVKCPDGFKQHKKNKFRCLRPGRESLGTPFLWIKSDK